MNNFKITKSEKKSFETYAKIITYSISSNVVLVCGGVPHNYAHLSSLLTAGEKRKTKTGEFVKGSSKVDDTQWKIKTARNYHASCMKFLVDKANRHEAKKTRKKWTNKNTDTSRNNSLLGKPSVEALRYAKWQSWIPLKVFSYGEASYQEAYGYLHSYQYSTVQEAMSYFLKITRQKPKNFEWLNDDPVRKNQWQMKMDNTETLRLQYLIMKAYKKHIQQYLMYGKRRGEWYLNNSPLSAFAPYYRIIRLIKEWFMTQKSKGRPRTIRSKKQAELLINRMTENMITSHMPEVSEKKALNTGGWKIQPVSTEELLRSYVYHPRFQILKDRLYPEIKGQVVRKVTLKIFKAIQRDVYDYFSIRWVTRDGVRRPIATYSSTDIHAPPEEKRKVIDKHDPGVHRRDPDTSGSLGALTTLGAIAHKTFGITAPEPKHEWYDADIKHWTVEQQVEYLSAGGINLDEFRQLKRAEPPPEQQEEKEMAEKLKKSLKPKEESFDPFSMGWSDEQIKRFFANL
jgi:hypothetical protein